MTPPKIVLIGPPGAGKSTVARALSKKTSLAWIDTDRAVESTTSKEIPEIFLSEGEEAFRAIERKEVAKALQTQNTIVSLGGGAILNEETQRELRGLPCVCYLEVSISNAAPRVGFNRERPLLMVNPRQQWIELMNVRRPIYESLATTKISTDNRKADEVAQEIIEKVLKP